MKHEFNIGKLWDAYKEIYFSFISYLEERNIPYEIKNDDFYTVIIVEYPQMRAINNFWKRIVGDPPYQIFRN